jgi:isopentenyl diphosphate isomerase/L-lactate dehydrogenase-like FMN-dependent dehydrogenase
VSTAAPIARQPGAGRLARIRNHHDARAVARRVLPRGLFEYVDGGADDEVTLRRNRQAFRDVTFRPRMATRNPAPDLRTTVLGTEVTLPVLTAPCGGMRLVHPSGDLGIARAAAAAGTIHVATSASGYPLEDIAAQDGPQWFQLYRFYHQAAMENLVRRAQAAGYRALVVTVDTTVGGNREKDYRNGFSYDLRVNARNALRLGPQLAARPAWLYRFWRDGMPFVLPNTANLTKDGKPLLLTDMARTEGESHSPSWEDIAWIRRNWQGPLLIKGLLTAEDARRAADAGADGVIVSNHGGRQLDGAPATLDALPEIVAAVSPATQVLLDSGVCRGTDVLKALALGARAVLIGRHAVWGLAVGGEAGVRHMIEILRGDMVRAMRLMGCRAVTELDRTWIDHPSLRRADAALPHR